MPQNVLYCIFLGKTLASHRNLMVRGSRRSNVITVLTSLPSTFGYSQAVRSNAVWGRKDDLKELPYCGHPSCPLRWTTIPARKWSTAWFIALELDFALALSGDGPYCRAVRRMSVEHGDLWLSCTSLAWAKECLYIANYNAPAIFHSTP